MFQLLLLIATAWPTQCRISFPGVVVWLMSSRKLISFNFVVFELPLSSFRSKHKSEREKNKSQHPQCNTVRWLLPWYKVINKRHMGVGLCMCRCISSYAFFLFVPFSWNGTARFRFSECGAWFTRCCDDDDDRKGGKCRAYAMLKWSAWLSLAASKVWTAPVVIGPHAVVSCRSWSNGNGLLCFIDRRPSVPAQGPTIFAYLHVGLGITYFVRIYQCRCQRFTFVLGDFA